MRAPLLQQAQVLKRIAIDGDEVGECFRLDAAEPPRHAHDLRVGGGSRADHLVRLHHRRLMQELPGLIGVEDAIQIAAVADAHAGGIGGG